MTIAVEPRKKGCIFDIDIDIFDIGALSTTFLKKFKKTILLYSLKEDFCYSWVRYSGM